MSNAQLSTMAATCMGLMRGSDMADAALYLPAAGGDSVACRVLVDRNVEDFGFASKAANAMVSLTVLVAEVGTPRRGDVFVVGSDQWMVDGTPLEADEATVMVPVRQVAP